VISEKTVFDTKIKPHLIQRGKFKSGGEPTGYDALVSNDYMGSSEFEFGALPKSLRAITVDLDSYKIHATDLKHIDGRGLFLVCKDDDEHDLQRVVRNLLNNVRRDPYWLKEPTYLSESLTGTKHYDFEIWWDIENHWFAVLSKDNARQLLKGLKSLKERWSKK